LPSPSPQGGEVPALGAELESLLAAREGTKEDSFSGGRRQLYLDAAVADAGALNDESRVESPRCCQPVDEHLVQVSGGFVWETCHFQREAPLGAALPELLEPAPTQQRDPAMRDMDGVTEIIRQLRGRRIEWRTDHGSTPFAGQPHRCRQCLTRRQRDQNRSP
jgi:hypothetical protein